MQKIRITNEMREQIRTLAGYCMTWPQIGNVMKVHHRTLQRHCQEDYDAGRGAALGAYAGTLSKKALSGNVPALVFILKTQFGWKETSKHELIGEDGDPIKTETSGEVSVNPVQLQEQVKAIVSALEKEF